MIKTNMLTLLQSKTSEYGIMMTNGWILINNLRNGFKIINNLS